MLVKSFREEQNLHVHTAAPALGGALCMGQLPTCVPFLYIESSNLETSIVSLESSDRKPFDDEARLNSM